MEKVLVTGGCGFIGSSIVDVLLNAGKEIYVIDNLSLGKDHWENKEIKPVIFKESVLDKNTCEQIFMQVRPSAVIHLAAHHYIPFCEKNAFEAYSLNVNGTLNILECVRKSETSRMFFASTGDVYPPNAVSHREVDTIAPVYVYGHTKMLGEQLCIKFFESSITSPNLIIGRLFNATGPRETNPHLIPEIVKQIAQQKRVVEVGNLWPLRDYVDVKSMAEIIVELTFKIQGIEVVNIGSGKVQTVGEALNTLCSVLPFKVEMKSVPEKQRPNDRPYLCPDVSRLKRIIGRAASSFSSETAKSIFNEIELVK